MCLSFLVCQCPLRAPADERWAWLETCGPRHLGALRKSDEHVTGAPGLLLPLKTPVLWVLSLTVKWSVELGC